MPQTQKRRPFSTASTSASTSRSRSRSRSISASSGSQKTKKQKKNAVLSTMNTRQSTKQTNELFNRVCTIGSDLCLALTVFRIDLLNFFDYFVYFNNAESETKRIGADSVNGIVTRITYEKGDITCHAILKSAQKSNSDNLAYEFLAGQCVNMLRSKFPCFVETYGLFYYKDDTVWKKCTTNRKITTEALQNALKLTQTIDFDTLCYNSKRAVILVENIPSAISMYDILHSDTFEEFANTDLLGCLYQIYYVLSAINVSFTHYDLHDDNVVLYPLPPGKYITYNYTLPNRRTITFHSKYIVKIIDYGRCFFVGGMYNSLDIFNRVNSMIQTRNKNLRDIGFYSMSKEAMNQSQISSHKRNISSDLRLLKVYIYKKLSTSTFVRDNGPLKTLRNVLSEIVYGVGTIPRSEIYGTRENLDQTTYQLYNPIFNVCQAEQALRSLFPMFEPMNTAHYQQSGYTNLGNLRIDGINDMQFEMTG